METIKKLEKMCHGDMAYLDYNKELRCGNRLDYINLNCQYKQEIYCTNSYYVPVIFDYNLPTKKD